MCGVAYSEHELQRKTMSLELLEELGLIYSENQRVQNRLNPVPPSREMLVPSLAAVG
jgi:hypothetical protein